MRLQPSIRKHPEKSLTSQRPARRRPRGIVGYGRPRPGAVVFRRIARRQRQHAA